MAIGREQGDVEGQLWLVRPELIESQGGVSGIAQEGLTIPWPVFSAMIFFGIGIIVGPAILGLTTGGQNYLKRAAEQRFA